MARSDRRAPSDDQPQPVRHDLLHAGRLSWPARHDRRGGDADRAGSDCSRPVSGKSRRHRSSRLQLVSLVLAFCRRRVDRGVQRWSISSAGSYDQRSRQPAADPIRPPEHGNVGRDAAPDGRAAGLVARAWRCWPPGWRPAWRFRSSAGAGRRWGWRLDRSICCPAAGTCTSRWCTRRCGPAPIVAAPGTVEQLRPGAPGYRLRLPEQGASDLGRHQGGHRRRHGHAAAGAGLWRAQRPWHLVSGQSAGRHGAAGRGRHAACANCEQFNGRCWSWRS